MRGLVFLCLLGAVMGQDFSWHDVNEPGTPDPNTNNPCLTDTSSCGCCLMQKQMERMERFFNMSLDELQRNVEMAQAALNNIRASRSAFSVALADTRGCLGPFREERPVVYSVVFINLGESYSTETGGFLAPRSGIYVLAVTVYSDAGSMGATLAACASLRINGQEVAALSEQNMQDHEDSATAVLAHQLRAGDFVTVILPPGCFLCDESNHYNTFTGFLLYATD